MSIVTWLVDRFHVSTTPTQVVREFARRCQSAAARGTPIDKPARKALYLEALQRHAENQAIYRRVMNGTLNTDMATDRTTDMATPLGHAMSRIAIYRAASGRIRRYPVPADTAPPRIMHWIGEPFHLDTIETETAATNP